VNEARYFRVGLFVLGGIVLAVATILIVGGGRLFARPVLMETVFDESVQGLDVGAPVKLRGVKLGSVSWIGFVGDKYVVTSGDATALEPRRRPGQPPLDRSDQPKLRRHETSLARD